MNVTSLISSVFPIGAIGLTSYISKLSLDNASKANSLIKYFIKLNFIVVLILFLPFIFFSGYLIEWFSINQDLQPYFILFYLVIPFTVLTCFIDLYLKGIRKINLFVLVSSVNSLASIIIFIPMVFLWHFEGAVIGFILIPIVNSVIGLVIVKRFKTVPSFKNTENPDKVLKTNIIKVGISSMVILFLQNITYLFIRAKIISSLGEVDAGIFQSVYAVSNNYFAIFFSLMSVHSIPKLSQLNSDSDKIAEINHTLKFMLLIYTPMILIFYIFRITIITLFYSTAFLPAESLFFYQLGGDFFRVLSWVFGLWLIPSVKIKQWFLFDLFFYIIFVSIFYFLFVYIKADLIFVSIAYLLAYFLHFVVNFVYILKSLKFKFDNFSLKIILSSFLLIAICFLTSKYLPSLSYYAFGVFSLIWLIIVYRGLNLLQFKEIILNKFSARK